MTFPPFLLASTCCPRIARVASSEELGTMSKNNLRRITLVRGPIWGIHSLTLIISCLKLKCQCDENCHHFFFAFLAQNSQFDRKTLFDVKKIEYNDSSGRKKCYKLTNFSSTIDRNRFQLSPQFNSSRSSYDVILVTFHDVLYM